MKYNKDEWNHEPVYFRDGEGLLVPGIEDNFVYDIASNKNPDDKTRVVELDINPPKGSDRSYDCDTINLLLKRYLKDRDVSKGLKYHCYVIFYSFGNSWYHAFEFKLSGDTVLIVRTASELKLYINKKEAKYTNDRKAVVHGSTVSYMLEELCKYLDKRYFADVISFKDYSYERYMHLLLKLYASEDEKQAREDYRSSLIKARESVNRKSLLGLFNEVLSNNK